MLFYCLQKCNEKRKVCNKNDKIWRKNIEGTVFRKEHRESDFSFGFLQKAQGGKVENKKARCPAEMNLYRSSEPLLRN